MVLPVRTYTNQPTQHHQDVKTCTHLFQCVLELVNKAGKTSGRMIWMFSPIKVTIYGLFQ